jgi:hypothetical protein
VFLICHVIVKRSVVYCTLPCSSTRISKFFPLVFLPFFVTNNLIATRSLRLLFPPTTITISRRMAATVITNTRNDEEWLETCRADPSQVPGMFFTTSHAQNATKTGTTRSRARWTKNRLKTCPDASRTLVSFFRSFSFSMTNLSFLYLSSYSLHYE